MSRPRTCICDACPTCTKRAQQARWWASLTDEDRARRNLAKRPAVIAREKRMRKENALKHNARNSVRRALRAGRLTKGPCANADARCSGQVEGHHDDYARPLDVRWLCKAHHELHHQGL